MALRQLASHWAGNQNLNKGSNRIQRFESGGKVTRDLFAKLTSILEVSLRRSSSFVGQGTMRNGFCGSNVPIRPYIVSQAHRPVLYQRLQLPDDALSSEPAKDYAARLAQGKQTNGLARTLTRVESPYRISCRDSVNCDPPLLESEKEFPDEGASKFGDLANPDTLRCRSSQ